jgi:hypothetical protein
MTEEVNRWRSLASRLGVEVIAPATIIVGDDSVTFTALLPQFGAPNGVVAHADWNAIGPHASTLGDLGYGFSTVTLDSETDDESAKEMLRDWGWSAPEPMPLWW